MLHRQVSAVLPGLRRGYQAIAITGPRQSGKTTLARMAAPDLPYVNFESPVERSSFVDDPRGFFRRHPSGAILDEVQHVPDLWSHLQVEIDAAAAMGRWVLTGSQQLELGRGISQSLAGRVALVDLLPLSYAELRLGGCAPRTLAEAVLRGGYPALYDDRRQVEPARWLDDYLATFVGRDVQHLLDVRNRHAFDRFVRLCAARTGQILNTAELGRDCGVDQKTAASWLSVLEACYLIRRLAPHHRNFGKRLIKSSKLHMIDTGVACRLLHISDPEQLAGHPQWGALAESWCVGEAIKARLHRGLPANAWYWRSSDGIEVDLLLELGQTLHPVEVKATSTPQPADAAALAKFAALAQRDPATIAAPGLLIAGGEPRGAAGRHRFVPWTEIAEAIPEGR